MVRQFLWLVFDIVVGVILTGVLAPLTIPMLPERYRGGPALWVLVFASVVVVAGGRRVFGIGAVGRPE